MDFKGLIKKQGLGTWISLCAVVLTIVGLIVYGIALKGGMDLEIANGSQPFYVADRPEDAQMIATVIPCAIVAMVAAIAGIVIDNIKLEGIVGKICELVAGACRVIVPVLLAIATLNVLYGSFTGLGWTYFSNEELLIADAAKAVGAKVIAELVILGIALVASIVAVFFDNAKKEA